MSSWDIEKDKFLFMHIRACENELSWDVVLAQTWVLMKYAQTDFQEAYVLANQKHIMEYLNKEN